LISDPDREKYAVRQHEQRRAAFFLPCLQRIKKLESSFICRKISPRLCLYIYVLLSHGFFELFRNLK